MPTLEKKPDQATDPGDISPSEVQNGTVSDHGADAALSFLRQQFEDDENGIVNIQEKKLVWKIDFMIMPLMWCCYFLQYLDKTLINYVSSSCISVLYEPDNALGKRHGSSSRHKHHTIPILAARSCVLRQLPLLRTYSCLPYATIPHGQISRHTSYLLGNLCYNE